MEYAELENKAISLLGNYFKSVREILSCLPFAVVNQVLEYVFSMIFLGSSNWPVHGSTKDFCIALRAQRVMQTNS